MPPADSAKLQDSMAVVTGMQSRARRMLARGEKLKTLMNACRRSWRSSKFVGRRSRPNRLQLVARIAWRRWRRSFGLSAPSWCRKDQVIADKDGQIQRLREDLAIDQIHGVLRGDAGGRYDARRASIVNNQGLMVEFRDSGIEE